MEPRRTNPADASQERHVTVKTAQAANRTGRCSPSRALKNFSQQGVATVADLLSPSRTGVLVRLAVSLGDSRARCLWGRASEKLGWLQEACFIIRVDEQAVRCTIPPR